MATDKRTPTDKIKQMNALSLAYAGDSVYELYVRELILKKHPGARVSLLHKMGSSVSNCTFQSGLLEKLRSHLTDDEASIVKRGSNAKPHSFPRNASKPLYIEATAFEALLGYVYLSGDKERLMTIFELIKEDIEHELGSAGL